MQNLKKVLIYLGITSLLTFIFFQNTINAQEKYKNGSKSKAVNTFKDKKWFDAKEYPFDDHFYKVPVGNMHYIDEGEGDPIVMVHGNPGWSFEFRNEVKALSKTNRCIVPDHIGFGLSDKPYDWDYLPEHHAENLELLLDSLDLTNITLVVNDWGGPIGLSYALKHPEKIKRIVIMNTWMWSLEDDEFYQSFSNFFGKGFGKSLTKRFNFFGKVALKGVLGDKKSLSKKIHKYYYKHMETPKERKGCYTFPKEIIDSSEWLASLWSQKSKIDTIPTTFIWGMKDRAFRDVELKYWVDNWNNFKVIELEEVGHFPQEESPQVLINELREIVPAK
ncbi:alpha/beta fold hydrolase [Flammeovirga kamogawensis]|uniref:Alpha/beta fold hydrolase n=1 Tax=Flammeovirga kamogawensis TaxID=373891 RepID=A0ABX8H3K1_9BACT|nr:alpha/beta fold hydrolase [Flammeovirga kamogawensis]MBB6463763.1 haloalkane dehalogenase [Flammeovirga kamogawensis]QWG09725.1 alpha/beta fold hydrolase [Flammeovirga kamogawensis]TRX65238.1 alpha/beta fold hydrolase [Flammeovirga kamogawensis]